MNGLSRERLVSHVIEEHSGPSGPSAQSFEMVIDFCTVAVMKLSSNICLLISIKPNSVGTLARFT